MPGLDERNQSLAEPTWDVAYLFPNQGAWSDEEYCALTTNRIVELSDGHLEVLSVPTEEHQLIVAFLHAAIQAFVLPKKLGRVLFAPFRVQLWAGKYREPDIAFMLAEHDDRREARCWQGADLVVEVVSEDDPDRDLRTKRDEYARAGIPEYWIVDPRDKTIVVLTLDESVKAYSDSGVYACGDEARSVLLAGFGVDVAEVFAAAEP